jgi:hypothetical protein
MKIKFYFFQTLIFISLLYPFFLVTKAQDSLYLVGTITGESTEQRIGGGKSIGDVNGDEYDDFIISMRTGNIIRDQGIVKLYLGSANFDLNANIIFHYPGSDSLNDFGGGSGVGDVNDDGYDDFVLVGAFGDFGFPKSKVFLYYGGETIDTIPVNEFYQPGVIQDGFGRTVSVGDINKDGFDDFTISSPYNWTNGRGYVYLFWGGDTISWERSITFTSDTLEDFFGASVANIGDINTDSYEDIAIGAPNSLSSEDTGKVYIYYGGEQMDNNPDTILISNNTFDDFGRIIKNAGDLNGDESIDFLIATGFVSIYLNIDSIIIIDDYVYANYVEASGNINNDEYDDFVIGFYNHRNSDSLMVGGAFIYLGSQTIDTVYKYKLEGETKWSGFGGTSFADINGDGFDDLLISAGNYPDYENPLGKVYIYSYNKISNVRDETGNHPNDFQLYQNYPNPFNPVTSIQYAVGSPLRQAGGETSKQFVTLKIYDILGREVVILINEEKPAGEYKIEFDASKYNLSSGVYFYRLQSGSFVNTKKMILLK